MQTDTLILIVAAGAALVAAIFAGMSWSLTKDASGSEAAINQNAGIKPVKVSDDTYTVIKKSLSLV